MLPWKKHLFCPACFSFWSFLFLLLTKILASPRIVGAGLVGWGGWLFGAVGFLVGGRCSHHYRGFFLCFVSPRILWEMSLLGEVVVPAHWRLVVFFYMSRSVGGHFII